MAPNTFTMLVQKQGRMKYLLIVMSVPILFLTLLSWLMDLNILPRTQILFWPSIAIMTVLGYFLIFQKNHRIDVNGFMIIETDWRGRENRKIKAKQIHSIRRNFLNEIILFDENNTKLLCVEPNMSNFDLFQQWLASHNIY